RGDCARHTRQLAPPAARHDGRVHHGGAGARGAGPDGPPARRGRSRVRRTRARQAGARHDGRSPAGRDGPPGRTRLFGARRAPRARLARRRLHRAARSRGSRTVSPMRIVIATTLLTALAGTSLAAGQTPGPATTAQLDRPVPQRLTLAEALARATE